MASLGHKWPSECRVDTAYWPGWNPGLVSIHELKMAVLAMSFPQAPVRMGLLPPLSPDRFYREPRFQLASTPVPSALALQAQRQQMCRPSRLTWATSDDHWATSYKPPESLVLPLVGEFTGVACSS